MHPTPWLRFAPSVSNWKLVTGDSSPVATRLADALGIEARSTGVPFSDAGWLLTNLFWKRQLTGRVTLMFDQVELLASEGSSERTISWASD